MKKILIVVFLCSISSCLLILLNGCETTSAASVPQITPSSTVIKNGNTVEFRASGGFEYEWSLQDDTLGRLDTRRGERVLYRSMHEPTGSNSAMQVLTVLSTITGTGQTTNTASYTQTAEAYITHISSSN